MPQRCSVPGCYSTYTNTYGVSFHTFPTEERVRQQWVRVCAPKIPNNAVLDHLRVCSLHFPQEDFIVNYRRAGPRLRRDAVPCIFTPDPRDTPDHVLALPRKGEHGACTELHPPYFGLTHALGTTSDPLN